MRKISRFFLFTSKSKQLVNITGESLLSATRPITNKRPKNKIIKMQDEDEQNFSAFWKTLEELETHIRILDGKTQIHIKLQSVTRGGFHILHT